MRRINIGNDENNNKDDMKILLRVQGADERFDKYKKRFHLPTTLWDICRKRNATIWSWIS